MDDNVPIDNNMNSDDENDNDEEMPAAIDDDDDQSYDTVDDESDGHDGHEGHEEDGTTDRVYLPDGTNDDGDLECDESAYIFYHKAKTSYPCLSFDVVADEHGDSRADNFPLSMTLVGGTQADKPHLNSIIVMKLSNMQKTKTDSNKEEENEEEEDSDSDDEDEDRKPILDCATISHPGCVNRVKATNIGGKPIVASWSESGRVLIWDISHPLKAVNNHHVMTNYVKNEEAPKPVFSFNGNKVEGYALAWSPLTPGVLATGDCNKNIHLWKPQDDATWNVDQRPYKGHTSSVEDIQWSPSENTVMASCSSDKSIRIWDIRVAPDKACMLTKTDAHESDVNVLSWNRFDPLILSGGDDGHIKVWDLRSFPGNSAVCTFKHHVAPITSLEWHPTDSTVYAASGADDQLTLWDLAVERDVDLEQNEQLSADVRELPPQLMFIHQGQSEIKELHWHSQMPGVLISTAISGFNVFRTISI